MLRLWSLDCGRILQELGDAVLQDSRPTQMCLSSFEMLRYLKHSGPSHVGAEAVAITALPRLLGPPLCQRCVWSHELTLTS